MKGSIVKKLTSLLIIALISVIAVQAAMLGLDYIGGTTHSLWERIEINLSYMLLYVPGTTQVIADGEQMTPARMAFGLSLWGWVIIIAASVHWLKKWV